MSQDVASRADTIDSIVDQLDRFNQRATYGAVAGVLKRSPRNLMGGRSRSLKDSWIVSGKDGLPTGYTPEQMHPDIKSRAEILSSADALAAWLQSPQ
ncbi:MAG TPA: hypothetical protein VM939_06700 [Gemmatimonadaceae bacterium]|nr:hypothetical protein [Gemmatimonadaceae bacterium]